MRFEMPYRRISSLSATTKWLCLLLLAALVLSAPLPISEEDQIRAEDEDIALGNARRREELMNIDELRFNNNKKLINEKRHEHVDWSVEGNCRIHPPNLTTEQCLKPAKTQHKCFSTTLNSFNYTDQSDTFGQFPHQLEFLRHFPRCWIRLAPLICLGHYRPCTLATPDTRNLYVLLQQIPTSVCLDMLDNCPFAAHQLLNGVNRNVFPPYLDCYEHMQNGRNNSGEQQNGNKLYSEDCKVNYLTGHPELEKLAEDSYQCLWPLVKSNNTKSLPIIDGCYMPCESALFPTESLQLYNSFIHLWHLMISLVIIIIVFTMIFIFYWKFQLNSNISKMKFELPKPLCLLISSELFATLIVSALFVYSNNRSENATCLDNGFGDGGTIRRYHGFRLPEGKENFDCAIQANLLNFSMLFVNWAFLLVFAKLILQPHVHRRLQLVFPKWDSYLLPFSVLLHALIAAIYDLLFEATVDPVNRICHSFLTTNNLTARRILCYLVIAVCVTGFVYYINYCIISIRHKEYVKPTRNWMQKRMANKQGISRNYECQEMLFGPRGPPPTDRLHALENGHIFNRIQHEEDNQKKDEEKKIDVINEKTLHKDETKNNTNVDQQQQQPVDDESAPLQGNIEEGCKNKQAATTVTLSNRIRSIPAAWGNLVWKGMYKIRHNFRLIFAAWAILLALRLLAGQMQISQEQESETILKSINCSINRTLSEGASIDWIDKRQYRNFSETNPHTRRRLLGQKTVRYCELEQFNMHWYWIWTILFGLNLLLSAAVFLTVAHFNDYLLVEHEIDEKQMEKANVEMHEIRRKKRWEKNESSRYYAEPDNESTNERRSSSSNDYEKISRYGVSVISTMIPPSTIPSGLPKPNNGNPQLPSNNPPAAAANASISPNNIQNGQNPPNGVSQIVEPPQTPANNFHIGNQNGNSPAASDFSSFCYSNYSLPPFLSQYQAPVSQQQQFPFCAYCFAMAASTSNAHHSAKPMPNGGDIQTADWVQQNCGVRHTVAARDNRWRPRAGSDPPTNIKRRMMATENQQQKDANGQTAEKTKTRRRKLHIRGAPKELKREWQKESERRKRRHSGGSHQRQNLNGNEQTEGDYDLSTIYNMKYRPGDLLGSSGQNPPQNQPIPNDLLPQLVNLLSTSAAASVPPLNPNCQNWPHYCGQYNYQYVLVPIMSPALPQQPQHQQQQQFAFDGLQQQQLPAEFQGIQQQLLAAAGLRRAEDVNVGEEELEIVDEDEDESNNENENEPGSDESDSDEDEDQAEEQGEEDDEDQAEEQGKEEKNEDDGVSYHTSSAPCTSDSLPSSTCEEDEEENLDSDLTDPEEEKLWEARYNTPSETAT